MVAIRRNRAHGVLLAALHVWMPDADDVGAWRHIGQRRSGALAAPIYPKAKGRTSCCLAEGGCFCAATRAGISASICSGVVTRGNSVNTRVRYATGSSPWPGDRFYFAAQALLANSGSNFFPLLSNAKHASFRPSPTNAAVVLIPRYFSFKK